MKRANEVLVGVGGADRHRGGGGGLGLAEPGALRPQRFHAPGARPDDRRPAGRRPGAAPRRDDRTGRRHRAWPRTTGCTVALRLQRRDAARRTARSPSSSRRRRCSGTGRSSSSPATTSPPTPRCAGRWRRRRRRRAATWPGAALPDVGQLTAQAGRIAGDLALIATRVKPPSTRRPRHGSRRVRRPLAAVGGAEDDRAGSRRSTLTRIGGNVDTGTALLTPSARSIAHAASRADSATDRDQLQRIFGHADTVSADLRATAGDLADARAGGGGPAGRRSCASSAHLDSILARLQAGEGTLGRLSRDATLYVETLGDGPGSCGSSWSGRPARTRAQLLLVLGRSRWRRCTSWRSRRRSRRPRPAA